MLYSYDIFDTILYRKVPKSTDIFILMEDEIGALWDPKFGSFSDLRRNTEFWLRRLTIGEISIEDIYGRIERKTHLSKKTIQKIEDIEYETEIAYTVLNQSVLNEIKKNVQAGDSVVLISDMYWHEEQIREWLSKKDTIFNGLPIYVSCDYGVTKSSGKLFELVKEKEKADFSCWVHTGDNHKADGEMPKRFGISNILVKGSRRYDFEKSLNVRNRSILDVYGAIVEVVAKSNGEAFDLGTSIVAPMVYQYVDWVLRQAIIRRISTLYFVLRDGYILKQVADIIIEKKRLQIRTEYIFGSRVAWRFPEISVEKLKNLSVWDKSNWVFRDPAVTYVPLERLGFSKQEIDELFGAEFGREELYSFDDFKHMLDECLANKSFVDALQKNIFASRVMLDKYLEQTIDFKESFALVDTNSTGKTQADLNQMLMRINPQFSNLRFFYHTFIADTEPDCQTQFVFLNSKEADRRFPEAFFRAPYNQCYGYVEENDRVVPRFKRSDRCAWSYSFDYDSYLNGILEFCRRVGDTNIDGYVELLLKVVNFEIVSNDEIKQVAKMPFNPDIYGDEVLDFYPEISIRSLFRPFSELIYFPKGSYYRAGGNWPYIYNILNQLVKYKRAKR